MATLYQKKQKQKTKKKDLVIFATTLTEKSLTLVKPNIKNAEKSNNSDIESFTVTNPNIVSKLSKLIKHSKIISQQSETTETQTFLT